MVKKTEQIRKLPSTDLSRKILFKIFEAYEVNSATSVNRDKNGFKDCVTLSFRIANCDKTKDETSVFYFFIVFEI